MPEDLLLLPAYGVDHARNKAGRTFPEDVDHSIEALREDLRHSEAQLRGVQERIAKLRLEIRALEVSKRIYGEIMFTVPPGPPAAMVPLSWQPKPRAKGVHGTNSEYTNKGCRCDDCKEAHAAYNRGRKKLKELRENKQ